jgi:hypothetical protein
MILDGIVSNVMGHDIRPQEFAGYESENADVDGGRSETHRWQKTERVPPFLYLIPNNKGRKVSVVGSYVPWLVRPFP